MADVFISYSRTDRTFVERLCAGLSTAGVESWVDLEDIPPTAEFQQEIYAAIESSDSFLFVLSPQSVASKWCRLELEHAVRHGKRLVPIHRRDVGEAAPEALAKLHWLSFQRDDDFEHTLGALVTALNTDLARVKRHTQLLVRSTDWERRNHDRSVLLRGSDLKQAEEWLARAGASEPRSTELQAQFILASRRAETGRQRVWLGAATVALVLVTIFAVAAFVQRNEKERQRQIAFSRQLAAQSELVSSQQAGHLTLATLLAVEAGRLALSTDTHALAVDQGIRRGLSLLPVHRHRLQHDFEVTFVSFAREGQHLVTVTPRLVQVWSVADFQRVGRVDLDFAVASASFAPDGRYLALGGYEGALQILDLELGETLLTRQHRGPVKDLAFSADGGHFAWGGEDGVATVWTLAPLDEPSTFDAGVAVSALAFDHDGATLAVGLTDGRVRLWNPRAADEGTAFGHGAAIEGMVFIDSAHLVALDADGVLRVWDATVGHELAALTHGSRVEAMAAVSLDGAETYLASAGSDGVARVWRWGGGHGSEVASLRHDGAVTAVRFSSDGALLATASADRTGRVWDTATGREVFRMPHEDAITTVDFGHGAALAATGSKDGLARVWELTNDGFRRLDDAGTWYLSAFGEGGTRLLAVDADHRVRWWDVDDARQSGGCCLDDGDPLIALALGRDGESVATLSSDRVRVFRGLDREPIEIPIDLDHVSSMALAPAGDVVVLAGVMDAVAERTTAEYRIEVWSLDGPDPRAPRLLDHAGLHEGEVEIVVFSPDGTRLVTGGGGFTFEDWVPQPLPGRALVWDIAALHRITTIEHAAGITAAAFSRDGRLVATAGEDDMVKVASIMEDQVVAEVRHEGVDRLTFSPSGRYLASAGSQRDVRVWEVGSVRRVNARAITHDGDVRAAAFSGDEKFLATASDDRTGRVWAVDSGAEEARVHHDGPVEYVLFSADDRFITTISSDATIRRSPWKHDDMVVAACAKLSRNLSWTEWEQYMGGTAYEETCATLPIEPAERLAEAVALDQEGDRRSASRAFEQAVTLVRETPAARLSNRICWVGGLAGFGRVVMPACDHAVELEPDYGDYRDSRGLVHALEGNYEAAIDDFRFYLEWGVGTRHRDLLAKRRHWVELLERRVDPFDEATLDALLTEK